MSDSGAGIEAYSLAVQISISDEGSALDAYGLDTGETATKSDLDIGSVDDEADLAVGISSDEVSDAVEIFALVVNLVVRDSGAVEEIQVGGAVIPNNAKPFITTTAVRSGNVTRTQTESGRISKSEIGAILTSTKKVQKGKIVSGKIRSERVRRV